MITTEEVKITLTRNRIGFEARETPCKELAGEWQIAASHYLQNVGYQEAVRVGYANGTGLVGPYVTVAKITFFRLRGDSETTGWAGENVNPFAAALAEINDDRQETDEPPESEATLRAVIEAAFLAAEAADDAGFAAVSVEEAQTVRLAVEIEARQE